MKEFEYYVLDVFTNTPYQGNQLSVVHETEPLDLESYHKIAREFGYSETSFVHYSQKDKIFKVRSFTPSGFEVDGAGHNLLGAVCLALIKGWAIFDGQENDPAVMIKDTRIALKILPDGDGLFVGMKQSPARVIGPVPADDVSKAVGLNPEDILLTGIAINIVQTEVPHLMVPIMNLNLLKQATPNKLLLKQLSSQYNFEGFYLFTLNGISEDCLAETRFFNPSIGIDEDPATGTAAGPLAGYLQSLKLIEQGFDYTIVQGKYVDHPSNIRVHVATDGIWVSGTAVIVMEGRLRV